MKTHPARPCWSQAVGLLAAALLLPGCEPQGSPPPPTTPQATSTGKKTGSAEKTSFAEVTAQLDPGGSVYGYLSTAQWLEGLSRKLEPWRDLVLSLPDTSTSDRETIRRAFDVLGNIVKQSGIESVSGIGLSGIALEPGFYRSKFIVHHYPGASQGYLWTLFGTQAHQLDFADWLPTNTAWAASMDLDVPALWNAIRQHVKEAAIPDAVQGLDQFTQMAEQASGMKFDELLGSMAGHFAVALTLDPTKMIPIPMPDGAGLQVPEPGLILAMKVRNDRWFDWTDRVMASNPQVINGDNRDAGLRMRTVPVPLPLPMEVRPSVARAGDYLWVTSNDQLMKRLVEIKAGRTPGLRSTAEFKKLMDGLPPQGNQFAFASERLQDVLRIVQKAVVAAGSQQNDGPPPALMEKLFAASGQVAGASVGVIGPQGWLTVSQGREEPSTAMMLSAVVAPTAIIAGMTLPALAKAKGKAQSISCVNNLKQLGLAARIYATDHDDKFPPDILSMKDELGSPRVLICPLSPEASQAPALSWESLKPEAISYEYFGAGKADTGSEVQATLFRCRLHGHVCRMDGSVHMATTTAP